MRCKSGVQAVAFTPDGQALLTAEAGKVVRRWWLPLLPGGEPVRVVRWTEVLTGMRLNSRGAANPLSAAAWEKCRRDLEELGGPLAPPLPSPEQVREWHRREADECGASRQWFAARWHLDRLLALDPRDAALCGRRGQLYAEQAQWSAAAADFTRAIELQPAWSTEWWQQGVLAHLAAGDAAGYRRLCELLASRLDPRDNPAVEKLAALCLLAPGALADMTWVVQLAEGVAARQPKAPRHHHTLGALLYRAGRYREALERLQVAARLRGSNDHVHDQLFLALTYRALHNAPEARRHLDRAEQLLARTTPENAEAGGSAAWDARLELQLLRREAEALLAPR
jgi:tetratricopeptide (TPR) repeat protein